MKKKLVIAVITFLLGLRFAQAQQPKYEQLDQLWAGYFNSLKINSAWAVNSDFQGRTTDWYKQWSQVIARTGITYKLNSKFAFSIGFADFLFFKEGNRATKNEYRPWGEIALNDAYNALKITHRFRFEYRDFQTIANDELTSKYNSNYRFRYKVDFLFPLTKNEEGDKALYLQFGNEIMINAGKSVAANYFDQNRTSASVLYTANPKLSFQLQYINIFQLVGAATTLDRINVIRFTIYHSITL